MDYTQTLDYLYSRLPMFHRIGAAAYKADLKNTVVLCELLDHPENKFKSIHIAGTNGKGSTSHMLAAILQKAGYKTGLYTSPHLKDFRERIRINGKMIPEQEVMDFVEKHKAAFEKIDLSFFEWTVGLCFDYFAREKVDIAVIETGLGGRLDSTNVITPELSVITNISKDHMNLLGDTLEKIATEKAGIIKPRIPALIGESDVHTKHVFIERANKMQSPVSFPSESSKAILINEEQGSVTYNIQTAHDVFENLTLDLTGNYQQKNVIGVLEAVHQLQQLGWKISKDNIYEALKDVKGITGLMGRWQKLADKPLTICDVGHNEAGIREVVKQLSKMKFSRLHMVLGMVNDKDISTVLALLPGDAEYYFCKADIPRAMEAEELQRQAGSAGLKGNFYSSVHHALAAAQDGASEYDLVFIGGSTFVVAEVL